jgi:uncharacterized Zn finger protein
MPQTVSRGSVCPSCGKGEMMPQQVIPVAGRFGFSHVEYRCESCGAIVKQIEDDRFLNL